MYGRYGNDRLNNAIAVLYFILIIFSGFLRFIPAGFRVKDNQNFGICLDNYFVLPHIFQKYIQAPKRKPGMAQYMGGYAA